MSKSQNKKGGKFEFTSYYNFTNHTYISYTLFLKLQPCAGQNFHGVGIGPLSKILAVNIDSSQQALYTMTLCKEIHE